MHPLNGPRRLVLLTHYHELFGGGEWSFDELVRGIKLLRPDVQMHVVVSREGELSERYNSLAVTVHVIHNERWADYRPFGLARRLVVRAVNLRAVARLTALLREVGADAALTNTMTVPALALAARRAKVPHLWLMHEFGDELSFLHGYEETVRRIGKLSTRVICNSEAVRRALKPLLGRVETDVAYCGVDVPDRIPMCRERGAGPLRAVLMGRMSEAKGQRVALEALALARARGADVSLHLAGQCDPAFERLLRADAARLGIHPNVEITPARVSPWPFYTSAHVALVCGQREGFGRVTVEAQKCGLAVCAARSGATPEIVEQDVTGLLHDYGDSAGLAGDLVRLESDEDLRRRLGDQARLLAGQRFSVPSYANRVLALAS